MTAIDISYWQGHPNFAQVKAAGVSLVIMKCGGGEGGRLYGDSVYVANRTASRAQGLAVGSYLFNGPVDPTAAADYQWSIIDWKPADIVALDVENATGVTRWNPAQVLAWVNRILSHGVPASKILIYMSSSVTTATNWAAVVATGVGLWVAQYGSNNGTPQGSPKIAYWPSWSLWQYTSAKTWPGIAGNVDTNQIAPSWAGGTVTPFVDPATVKKATPTMRLVTYTGIASQPAPLGPYDPKRPSETGNAYYIVADEAGWNKPLAATQGQIDALAKFLARDPEFFPSGPTGACVCESKAQFDWFMAAITPPSSVAGGATGTVNLAPVLTQITAEADRVIDKIPTEFAAK